jgi:molybdate-binding protein
LKDVGIDPGAIRFPEVVRIHHAVAVAVASGRAQLDFGARMAAEKARIYFRESAEDRIDFLMARSSLTDEGIKAFGNALGSEDFRRNLVADY